MRQVEAEVDRYLILLGNKIRQQGFTQLEVQESLGWGRSYISQLLTKQKSLRIEQVLLILNVIGTEPAEFFAELYPRAVPYAAVRADPGADEEQQCAFQELRALFDNVVRLLLKKGIVTDKELTALAVRET